MTHGPRHRRPRAARTGAARGCARWRSWCPAWSSASSAAGCCAATTGRRRCSRRTPARRGLRRSRRRAAGGHGRTGRRRPRRRPAPPRPRRPRPPRPTAPTIALAVLNGDQHRRARRRSTAARPRASATRASRPATRPTHDRARRSSTSAPASEAAAAARGEGPAGRPGASSAAGLRRPGGRRPRRRRGGGRARPRARAPARGRTAPGDRGPGARSTARPGPQIRDAALRAERLGFDGRLGQRPPPVAGAGEARARPSTPSPPSRRSRPLTERARLGMAVLSASYRPAPLAAKMATILDVISGGRLIRGPGHRVGRARAPRVRGPVRAAARAHRARCARRSR